MPDHAWRLRLERKWLWTVAVNVPGAPYDDAETLDEAKARFKTACIAFRDSTDLLAKVFDQMNHANRPDRYRQR